MSQLVESIKCRNGKAENLEFHQKRLNEALKKYFKTEKSISLQDVLLQYEIPKGLSKCRVVYSPNVEMVEFVEYVPKKVERLKIIHDDTIEYRFKYTDRAALNELFAQKGIADDVLIIKNGYVTDTSSSNVCFLTGNTWVTPSSCLLKGTKREMLLSSGVVEKKVILEEDIYTFSHIILINAMLDLEMERAIPIENIIE